MPEPEENRLGLAGIVLVGLCMLLATMLRLPGFWPIGIGFAVGFAVIIFTRRRD